MHDIGIWLESLQLGVYRELFAAQRIDLDVLGELNDADLRDLGIPLGDRKRLLRAIAQAQPDPPSPEAERRQLTVMFVDLVDSTPLTQRLDPEELRLLFQGYQNTVAGEISRYEGYPAQFLGDGVMAYFGWPRAHEDAAERAVRTGLKVALAVARLSAPDGTRLAARVSIATGTVVVNNLLTGDPVHNTPAVGETPHLAARLQTLAAPGEVVIGEATARLVESLFDLQSLGAHRLKGIATPVSAHRVTGVRPLASRFEARDASRALIGRSRELAILEVSWRQALAGQGQLLVLEGEAGIGKSRIARALLDSLDGQRQHRVVYQCSPYHTSNPLYPLARYLWQSMGLRPGVGEAAEIRRRLARWLEQALPADPRSVEQLAALLGSDGPVETPDITSQKRRMGTLELLIQWLLESARQQPLLLVVEDTQWIDPSTRELLAMLVARLAGVRMLVMATARPTRRPLLEPAPRCLTLDRLDRRATLAMVDGLCGGKPLPPVVREEITARTDGVPLFVEELTRTVLESGQLRETAEAHVLDQPWQPLSIPTSLQDSLLARLDRLADSKPVAQTAACMGREFSRPLLEAVLQWPAEHLHRALQHLQRADLLELRVTQPHQVFGFRHSLIRDAAYQSLLKSHRRRLHARIAMALEERFPAWVVAAPQLLAYHFTEAGRVKRAVQYWVQAAQRSLGQFANHEAADYATRGIALLEQHRRSPERDRQELVLQFVLGAASRIIEGYAVPSTERAFSRAVTLARRLQQQDHFTESARGLWSAFCVQGKLEAGRAIGEQVLAQADDDNQRLLGHYMAGVAILLQGETDLACRRLETALSLHIPDHPVSGLSVQSEPRIYLLAFLGLALGYRGNPREGIARGREAVARARDQGLPLSEVDALVFLCNTLSYYREPLAGEVQALSVLADRYRMVHYQPLARFRVAMDSASLAPAARLRVLEVALQQYREVARVALPGLLAQLASVALKAGAVKRAAEAVAEGLALVEDSRERHMQPELQRVLGVIRLRQRVPDPPAAEAALHQALGSARAQGAKLWELRAAMSLTRLLLDQGRRPEARALLAPVLGRFGEDQQAVLLHRARELLATLVDRDPPRQG